MPEDALDQAVDVLRELTRQPALADTCRTDHRYDADALLATGSVEEVFEQAHLFRSAHERRLQRLRAVAPAALGHDAQCPPRRDRRLLALESLIVDALEGDRRRSRSLSGLADEHGAGQCHGLQAAGGVNKVARNHALVRR